MGGGGGQSLDLVFILANPQFPDEFSRADPFRTAQRSLQCEGEGGPGLFPDRHPVGGADQPSDELDWILHFVPSAYWKGALRDLRSLEPGYEDHSFGIGDRRHREAFRREGFITGEVGKPRPNREEHGANATLDHGNSKPP